VFQKPRCNYSTVLDELVIDNHIVANCLIDQVCYNSLHGYMCFMFFAGFVQKLIRGLKRVAWFHATKYSNLISIFLTPYLVKESSIQNGGLAAKQSYHEISLILLIRVLDEFSLFYDYYDYYDYIKSVIHSSITFRWKK